MIWQKSQFHACNDQSFSHRIKGDLFLHLTTREIFVPVHWVGAQQFVESEPAAARRRPNLQGSGGRSPHHKSPESLPRVGGGRVCSLNSQ